MHPEIKENFQEKMRLVVLDLMSHMDEDIKAMLAEHSAKGLLRSGNTIKRTMDFIAQGNASLYQSVLDYFQDLNLAYYPTMEVDIQSLAISAQELYKTECLPRFQKSIELAGKPSLYERMLPEVESGMATDLAKFQNSLNAVVVQIKLSKEIPPMTKVLWGLEALLLLSIMFIAGMWFKDPEGNYEPLVVGLSIAMPLVLVGIKLIAKKVT
ncbi:hypothetical protein [Microbulbifer sp. TRSA005]|uniref:hypothetical protein n=1 Tax=Microbulbifer sp. TRSA005 TaxID=3243383 RepID=UPI00403A27C4